jgi:hypothetical protein
MSRLTIVLWLWKGWRPVYDRRDINAVSTMLRERGQLPDNARIILMTDQPTDWWSARTKALDVEEFKLWPDPVRGYMPGRPNCFRRLRLFNPMDQESLGIRADDIVMSMDADSIVCGSIPSLLPPLLERTHTFAGMAGQAARIHGSLFAFRAYTHAHLWSQFHPQLSPLQLRRPCRGRPHAHGSDQAWMTHNVTGEHLWHHYAGTATPGCYSWRLHGATYSPRYTENAVYWSFAGHNKPGSELVRQIRPDLHDIWMDAYLREPPQAAVRAV